jgi:hypothetical protein
MTTNHDQYSTFLSDFPHLCCGTNMGGRAMPDSAKRRNYRRDVEKAIEIAKDMYLADQQKSDGSTPRGYKAIRDQVVADFLRARKPVYFSHEAVRGRKNGRLSLSASREGVKKLPSELLKTYVSYTLSAAAQGLPYTRRKLHHFGNHLRTEIGLEPNLGKNWVDRWTAVTPELAAYRPKGHESQRAQAANRTNLNDWLTLLGDVMMARRPFKEYPDLKPIDMDCVYGANESGFQACGAHSGEKVYGASKQKLQYQQRGGSRETITVLSTICGDGTALLPSVIFKGEYFQSKWRGKNPLNAS